MLNNKYDVPSNWNEDEFPEGVTLVFNALRPFGICERAFSITRTGAADLIAQYGKKYLILLLFQNNNRAAEGANILDFRPFSHIIGPFGNERIQEV